MKVTLNWLKEFVEIDLSAKDLAERLTHAGLEVESIESVGNIPQSVRVVQIKKIEKHPQADRLTLCEVDLGGETRKIVCGAKNMKEGDCVPLALPGTLLPDGKAIESSKIRGVVSEGMLCSEKELGLFEESEGLLILPSSLPLGKPLVEMLPLTDTCFEINVTPNRADCLSVMGIAREIAALTAKAFKPSSVKPIPKGFSLEKMLQVEIEKADQDLCPRYTARMIRGVKIGPSPLLVRLRLGWVGLRSINNVVDATNYVMMETGQPLHAFDDRQITGGKIFIRRAQDLKKMKTLDEVERELHPQDLLITDSEKVLALAGVMGGLSSGVTESTQNLVLEAAYFQPLSVRKTSRRLGLQTESSFRFERGIDPNGVKQASDRLTELILNWAGGEASKDLIDTAPKGFPERRLTLRHSRTNSVLGTDFDAKSIESALHRLNLHPRSKTAGLWECEIPSYRQDLEREIDLIEEVARVLGYDRIPVRLPAGDFYLAGEHDLDPLERKIRSYLTAHGFSEVIHYSFCSRKEIEQAHISLENPVRLSNPLSEDLSVLRPSLVPTLLSCIQRNLARQNQDLRIFEMRSVYEKQEASSQPTEKKHLSLAMTGLREGKHWAFSKEEVDFYDMKGMLEGLWSILRLPSFRLSPTHKKYLHPGMSAELRVGEASLGDWGVLHPQVALNFDISSPVVVGEFDLSSLFKLKKDLFQFKPLPRFPSVERDLTVVASEDLKSESVIQEIYLLKIPSIREVKLFDIYRGNPIPEGKKALTYSILYQEEDRTLTDEEVNTLQNKVVEKIKTVLPIEWR